MSRDLPLADQLHFELIRANRILRREFDDAQDRVAQWEPRPCPKRS